MTQRLYRDDPYLLEFDARVVARREHAGQPAVVLDRTAFFAESGGQPWDTGTLSGVAVSAVVEDGDDVIHVLEAELPVREPVHGLVDGERRRDHLQQHHGQHLLTRAFVELAAAQTVSFHLGAAECTIDLDRPVDTSQLATAQTRANEIVWAGRPVSVRTVSRTEADALGAKAAGLAGDRVRLVEAEGFDVQACSGTHPRSTSEVGVVLVLGAERYKAGSRVRFVCGHRALAAFRVRAETVDRLAGLLSAPLAELPEIAQRTLDQLSEAERRARVAGEQLLRAEARELLAGSGQTPARIVARFDGRPPAELRALAEQLVGQERPCLALLASHAGKAHLVFAQSPGLGHDIPALLRSAATIVGGRGGGRGDVAQGGGDRPERLDEALRQAEASVTAGAER